MAPPAADSSPEAVAPASPRQVLRDARRLLDALGDLRRAVEERRAEVRRLVDVRIDAMVAEQLETTSVDRLRDVADGLRTGALADAGFTTVAQIRRVEPRVLLEIDGVGPATVERARQAADELAEALRHEVRPNVDVDRRGRADRKLARALTRASGTEREVLPHLDRLERDLRHLADLVDAATTTRRSLRRLVSREARAQADEAVARLAATLATVDVDAAIAESRRRLERAGAVEVPRGKRLWQDFEANAAERSAVLAAVADVAVDLDAVRGFVPTEVADRVEAQLLDTTHLTAVLRGYQSFGARFVLAQRRVILGDEMGLGKTVQAVAVLAHLAVHGHTHALVVCPSSVMANWEREVARHSDLPTIRLHGTDRDECHDRWRRRGGVALTTFDTLRRLSPPDSPAKPSDAPAAEVEVEAGWASVMVVDEAHYVKHAGSQRAQALRRWTDAADHVVFLTGTPMENRVSEFATLVGYLQPATAAVLDDAAGAAGATAFRRSVAQAYLRRNQADVLAELPELIEHLDWLDPTPDDAARYAAAVADGAFADMRRAMVVGGDATRCAKLDRLVALVDESAANGWKVVVFSYFRDVLDTVTATIADHTDAVAFGPLTGSMDPTARQDLVDAFSAHDGPAVLVSQIEAGGVGLNIQAASVVVLVEPQWKPTVEAQAVARCHRMGQLRRVRVHRLLAAGTVDERMVEVLAGKAELFDEFVRRSDLADVAPAAVDTAAGGPAAEADIVAAERRRLAATGPRVAP